MLRSGALVSLVVLGCRRERTPPTCTDTTGLSPEDAAPRTALAYVDRSPDPTRACDRCVQYIEASNEGCGGCKVLKGPISPAGTCKVFAAKS